ncbi:MAG: toll/interleukin-1 receptor domain-containing protein [Chloroflexi bacterium]|uniref:toll/interleukin-1 receptor domain-containing protein n=1 Tax=Candidatus Flexifilum breve TaxID=3140694 RepID=UPI003135DCE7|nr:toll/interleukin-1 receptor domain-containing protein [Chloroflexota bacterium]
MAHVFISYHKDSSRAYARQLADHLIARGFDVWIDDRIDFGSEWERAIFEDGLDRAAAVVVIMTKGAWESRWVRREREYAEFKRLPIIPLRAEDYIFPPYLATQFVDVRGWVLPPDTFLDALAELGVTRRADRGA